MTEDLPLPKLSYDAATGSFTQGAPRKRVRLSSPPVSSDPLFSDDFDEPSVDNYTQERRKRKFRGPWFSQKPEPEAESQEITETEPKRTKRPFERQFDSGVFMGSDGTDMDEAMEAGIAETPFSLPERLAGQSLAARKQDGEEDARRQVELCLEEGNEHIDLSSISLKTLSNATIRPLATFTRIARGVVDGSHKLEPKLKLFLSSNNLTTLPGELFNLERLVALTVRNNELGELPPGIGKLKNLHELNLSQNGLRYLPYEILDLLKYDCDLNTLILHPNCFYEPQLPNTRAPDVEEHLQKKIGLGNRVRKHPLQSTAVYVTQFLGTHWNKNWKAEFRARTDIRYLDITGKLLKGPILPNSEDETSQSVTHSIPIADIEDVPRPPISRGSEPSRAPSLIEVSLAACSKTPQLPYLKDFLPEDSPPYLHNLLADAAAKKESGGSQCTVCKRNFVLARTEWIEWWKISKLEFKEFSAPGEALRGVENDRDVVESMVPLMRRGCSWLCVPEKLVEREPHEDAVLEDVIS
ncbi:leucine Rich Repeat family protein [Drepanopeziza brunnea f. sp. 'multigermtubi' MB_m1]|uniref:Leucine Rich Repeat family protein n=1 Tax=Marssonina brunnea f. sp. multigermtubi (strain MB_m1) TaxID=1072389 RepID=K1WTS3_MARBU|nr:leucine Rich Repeat family protein [Drepanopeziza brunnea f. sp. 'multigermtubi' MB_m1]EKD16456.1 leucine Rich Repeat family protein [Drepanopeziza brunnea f. sp. 'multigermtubi' MB_m1]